MRGLRGNTYVPYAPLYRLWPVSIALCIGLAVGTRWTASLAAWPFFVGSGFLLLLSVLLRLRLRQGRHVWVYSLLILSAGLVGLGRGLSEQKSPPPWHDSQASHWYALRLTSPPSTLGWGTSCQVQLLGVRAHRQWVDCNASVQVYLPQGDSVVQHLEQGDSVLAKGYYSQSLAETNPNTFKFSRWNRLRGVTGSISLQRGAILPYYQKARESKESLTTRIRREMLSRLEKAGLQDEAFALVAAMTLADKASLDRELKQQFARAGIAHILVLSGLHVGFVFMLLMGLVWWLPKRYAPLWYVRVLLPIVGIWAFVALCGYGLSLLRAAIMVSFVGIGRLGHSRLHPLDSLLLAAAVILFYTPCAWQDVGFQLSFSALWGIFCYTEPIERPIPERTKVGGWVRGVLAASLGAQLGTLPFTLYHFGTLPLLSILSNLFAIPLSGLIVSLGIGIELLPGATIGIQTLGSLERLLANSLLWLTRMVNGLPGLQLEGMRIALGQMLLLVLGSLLLGLYVWTQRVALRHLALGLIAYTLPLIGWGIYSRNSSAQIAVLYHSPRPISVLKQGSRLYTDADTTGRAKKILRAFASGLTNPVIQPLAERENDSVFHRYPWGWTANIHGRNIVSLELVDSLRYEFGTPPQPLDILILRGKPNRSIVRLLRATRPTLVVLATTRGKKGEKWLEGIARAEGIDCWSVKRRGAYLLTSKRE